MFFEFENKEKLDNLINNLNRDLGISINPNTYDYEILSIIQNYFSETNSSLSENINSNLYQNLKGEDLENFLNYFGITKLAGSSNDIYEFTIDTGKINTFSFPKKSQFIFEGFIYETTEDVIFNSDSLIKLLCVKIYNSASFENACFSEGGSLQFNVDNMIFNNDDEKIKTLATFPQNVKFILYNYLPKDSETDFEFLERSKSILQQLGFSNNKKIEIEILKDSRIKNALFDNANGLVKIIIIPKILDEAEEVLNHAKEIVNYYKNENIEVVSPNILGITITGITEQLGNSSDTKDLINLIYQSVEDYINYASVNGIIYKSEIINIINNILNKNKPGVMINPSGIIFGYRYFLNSNYEEFLIEDTINEYLKLNVSDAIVVSLIK